MFLRRRASALSLVLFVASTCAAGCATEIAPSTLEVSDVQPRELEIGDRFEVLGAGFPVRRVAHVVLRGNVHRPGLAPEPITLAVDTEARSEGRLEIPLSSSLADRLVGAADSATHATFRGDVLVTFAPAESGTAALSGKARDVVLDVHPPHERAAVLARREADARKLLDFVGIDVGKSAPASGGLVVATVRPDSIAARAGIEAGNVLVDADGVRIAAVADVAPATDVLTLGVRREGDSEVRAVSLSIGAYAQRVPRGYVVPSLLVAVAALLSLLTALPPSPRLSFIERRIADRLRKAPRPDAARIARALDPMNAARDGRAVPLATAFAAALALPLLPAPLGVELDVGSLLLVGMASLFAFALLGERGGARSALAVARDQIPALLATAAVVIATGSLRVLDVLRAQGAAPWEWFLFRTPALLLLCLTWMASAAAPSRARRPADAANVVVTSVMVAALFLGGFRLPGVALERDGWSGMSALAAVVFALKATVVAASVRALRAVMPRGQGSRVHSTVRRRIPVAIGAFVASAAWAAFSAPAGFAHGLALATFGAVIALGLFAALRVSSSVGKIAVQHVDPTV